MKIIQSGPQTPGNTYNVKNWLKNKNVTDCLWQKGLKYCTKHNVITTKKA